MITIIVKHERVNERWHRVTIPNTTGRKPYIAYGATTEEALTRARQIISHMITSEEWTMSVET